MVYRFKELDSRTFTFFCSVSSVLIISHSAVVLFVMLGVVGSGFQLQTCPIKGLNFGLRVRRSRLRVWDHE